MTNHITFKIVSCLFIFTVTMVISSQAQLTPSSYQTMPADSTLSGKSPKFLMRWGTNRRAEWAQPVKAPVLFFDSAYGKLTVRARGGGNESRTLQLRNERNEEYALRSINKSRTDVIPPGFEKTFIEDIIRDGVANSHPYGAFALAAMQDAIGIPHSSPVLVFIPAQPGLDTLNAKFGNDLYMIEERPDGNWKSSNGLWNMQDFSGTDKVIEKLPETNKYSVDQLTFAKARLFDMYLGDWDRHEDNFRWGKIDSAGYRKYVPVARDRDQVFYTHNGKWIDKLLPLGGFSFMQHFDTLPGNMVTLNVASRDLDRFFANQLDRDQWEQVAKNMQRALTDDVIRESLKGLPPEIYAIDGEELFQKLAARRSHLTTMILSYYDAFLAKEVEVIGSKDDEIFNVILETNGNTRVKVSGKNADHTAGHVTYERVFLPNETNEIRIFGIDGKDVFNIEGHSPEITVRVIGGPDADQYMQRGALVHIYDDRNNTFQTTSVSKHLANRASIHKWDYAGFEHNSKGLQPNIGFNDEDRIFAGLLYSITTHKWRRQPFASKHVLGVNYSFSQNNWSASYDLVLPRTIGKWDLFISAGYDAERWTNYFGIGNETKVVSNNINYHRTHTTEWMGGAGIRRTIKDHDWEFGYLYHHIKLKSEQGKFVTQDPAPGNFARRFQPYARQGVYGQYRYVSVNNRIVPTKGITFFGRAMLSGDADQGLPRIDTRTQVYLPLSRKFSLALRAGGTSLIGSNAQREPRLYEHAVIGGPFSLRGYRPERFWGTHAVYNNNELRFITDMHTRILNARVGLIGFFDNGRVWDESVATKSTKWHTAYGGGLLIAPFQQVSFNITYGVSPEMKLVQFCVNRLF